MLKRLGLNSQGLKNTLVQRLVNYIKNPSGVTAAPEEADRVREFASALRFATKMLWFVTNSASWAQ